MCMWHSTYARSCLPLHTDFWIFERKKISSGHKHLADSFTFVFGFLLFAIIFRLFASIHSQVTAHHRQNTHAYGRDCVTLSVHRRKTNFFSVCFAADLWSSLPCRRQQKKLYPNRSTPYSGRLITDLTASHNRLDFVFSTSSLSLSVCSIDTHTQSVCARVRRKHRHIHYAQLTFRLSGCISQAVSHTVQNIQYNQMKLHRIVNVCVLFCFFVFVSFHSEPPVGHRLCLFVSLFTFRLEAHSSHTQRDAQAQRV